jgi:hypothetical protein
MDSRIKIIEKLIATGNEFTFRNFCYPDESYSGRYGGADTSEWLEWKTRVRNFVFKSMAADSPAVNMVLGALAIRTEGFEPDDFERAKSTFLKALENTLHALQEDVYGELKNEESESSNPSLSNKVFIVHGHDSD